MMRGPRWPRIEYMHGVRDGGLAGACSAHADLQHLAACLNGTQVDTEAVSIAIRRTLQTCSQASAAILRTYIMTPDEISQMWADNGKDAAAAGTWTHALCECVLNGGAVTGSCAEMTALASFLGSTRPLLAYRTEWCIWGAEEMLAGCIDFAAMDANGELVCLGSTRVKCQWIS